MTNPSETESPRAVPVVQHHLQAPGCFLDELESRSRPHDNVNEPWDATGPGRGGK